MAIYFCHFRVIYIHHIFSILFRINIIILCERNFDRYLLLIYTRASVIPKVFYIVIAEIYLSLLSYVFIVIVIADKRSFLSSKFHHSESRIIIILLIIPIVAGCCIIFRQTRGNSHVVIQLWTTHTFELIFVHYFWARFLTKKPNFFTIFCQCGI